MGQWEEIGGPSALASYDFMYKDVRAPSLAFATHGTYPP